MHVDIRKTRGTYNEVGLRLENNHPKRGVKAKLRDDGKDACGPSDFRADGSPPKTSVPWA